MPQPGSDRVDFERLMRESYRLVYQIAYSVLGNAADAEEVTQDTFLAAYEKIGSLRDPERFRPWVARAGWRLALNRRRGTTRAMGRHGAWMADRPVSEAPEAEATEREFEVRAQVDLLPEKLKAVVLLIGVDGRAGGTVETNQG
jgi:RNA polymerase sigma factor (sigma-70 family)